METKKINYRVRVLLLALFVYWLQVLPVFSQVGINTTGNNPHSSAMLDVAADGATKGGLLIPRMTTAERNSITSPAQSLLIYNTTTKCFEFYENGMWQTFGCACTTPSAPTANAASSETITSFQANWSAVTGATTYYLDVNTNSSFTGTWILNNQNVGNGTSYVVTGLTCGTTYYYRVRAANSCGTSANSNVISVTTAACGPSCGTHVWMTANMNVGTRVNGSANQNNDSQVEKYCYNDQDANCTTYGGLYQWAEAVQLPYANNSIAVGMQPWMTCDPCGSGGRQGICPAGYHIPTDREWSRYEWCVEKNIVPLMDTPLSIFQGNTGWRGTLSKNEGPGAKLKASASNSPAWDGTNASGFTALPAGYRHDGGGFLSLGSYAGFWSATEASATSAWSRNLDTGDWQSGRLSDNKTYGFSVRCLKN
jgi:uncharacterized protein (TIGR02145 family)